ncbi:MAG: hypothetical protein IJ856_06900 [Candidatus Methanomethylophilaceae archaeon]|nr:hypothetical protein [Candidatus Methanomethylophilaceae archaeon]
MTDSDTLIRITEEVLRELDRSLGYRRSGATISGACVPTYRDVRTGEDPLYLTSRALVLPVMGILGYDRIPLDLSTGTGRGSDTVLTVVSMNRSLSGASERAVGVMVEDSIPSGIVTDGFRWILIEVFSGRPRISCLSDLRPYYVETLDRDRFKESYSIDREEAELFIDQFSRLPTECTKCCWR